jgi:hypothetical protein
MVINLEEKVQKLEKVVQRLEKMAQNSKDIQEIQNVMSRHAFLDAGGANREQIMEIFAQKQPDVSLGGTGGMWVGLESIISAYCDLWEKRMRPERLENMTRLFPDVPKVKENDLAGFMKMHTNCTPYIVVAGDGKTAKGTWESPGFITEISHGRLEPSWIWERYAVDFIKEDEKWKIWHFNGLIQFCTPYEQSWVAKALEPTIQQSDYLPNKMKQDVYRIGYEVYNPKKLCGLLSPNFPKQPVPYETFNATFSYGP